MESDIRNELPEPGRDESENKETMTSDSGLEAGLPQKESTPIKSPHILCEAAFFVLWLLATPPIINYQFLAQIVAFWIILLFVAHVIWWVYLIRKKRLPHIPRFIPWLPACLLLPMWVLLLNGEFRVIDSAYPAMILAIGAIVLILHFMRRLHGVPAIILCVLFGVLGAANCPSVLFLVGLAVCALLFGARILQGKMIYRLPAWVPAAVVMNCVAALIACNFYFVNGNKDPSLIAQQDGVEVLFTYEKDDPIRSLLGKQIMFVREGCDNNGLFIGTQGQNGGLIKYDLASGLAVKAEQVGLSSDNILLDCENEELVIGDFSWQSGLHFISLSDWPSPSRPFMSFDSLPFDNRVVRIGATNNQDRFYILTESSVFYAIQGTSGKALASLQGPDEWIYYPDRDAFIAFTEPDFKLFRFRWQGSKDESEINVRACCDLEIPINKRLNLYLCPGLKSGNILISDMWEGTVTRLNSEFEQTGQVFIAPGIRNLAIAPDRKTLVVAGYADGNIYFVDLDSWEVTARRFIGRRIRGLNFSASGRFLYAGSAQGGFRLDIPAILGETGGGSDQTRE